LTVEGSKIILNSQSELRKPLLLGNSAPTATAGPPRPIRDALIAWIDRDAAPADALDSEDLLAWLHR